MKQYHWIIGLEETLLSKVPARDELVLASTVNRSKYELNVVILFRR